VQFFFKENGTVYPKRVVIISSAEVVVLNFWVDYWIAYVTLHNFCIGFYIMCVFIWSKASWTYVQFVFLKKSRVLVGISFNS
jgi:hypothetical protein